MAHELNPPCTEFEPLLIRKITGELLPDQEKFLEKHLDQCAPCNSELEKVSQLWQGMESLPSAAVPAKLHDETQRAVLGLLRLERAWSYLLPVIMGIVMTALSYGLMVNLIDQGVHHHRIVISVFVLWATLIVVASWLMFRGKVGRISVVLTFSLSVTFMTLLLARLFSWNEVSSWIYGSWIDELLTSYLADLGHRFVIGWGSYACAAAFFGALLFGVHKSTSISKTGFLGSLIISVLLFPAIYLHGSSHGHSYSVIFFGAVGIFFGASIGTLLGGILRRQLSFSMV